MKFNLDLILDFFKARNWTIQSQGNLFIYLKPSNSFNFPQDFLLEIPKDSKLPGFDSYITRLIEDLRSLDPEFKSDELKILFNSNNSIIKYRIFDKDNENGTIAISKFIDSVEGFKNILFNAVNFTVNQKAIFGQTNSEANEFLRNCRVLQSEKGSYITKIEVPNKPLQTTFDLITTDKVNNKLFDVLEFVNEEILIDNHTPKFTENYIQDNSEFLNYELLKSIKEIYSKSRINNLEYTLCNKDYTRNIVTEKALPKIVYYEQYLKTLKESLYELSLFEAKGYIRKLTSNNPISSNNNEVILDGKKFGVKFEIKFHLRSEEYLEAIEAHKNHKVIKISGRARELKTVIHITEIEKFEILP